MRSQQGEREEENDKAGQTWTGSRHHPGLAFENKAAQEFLNGLHQV